MSDMTHDSTHDTAGAADAALDVDALARELDDVEVALARLDDGTYWTCEVSGEDLPMELLAHDPVARRRTGPERADPES
jgi:RNA polymerase-binding transcription factor DksA